MATVPSSRVWVAGEVVTAAFMNTNISAVQNWLLEPAVVQVYNSANQSIPNNAFTSLTFDLEVVDSTGMHSTVTNTSRLTAVYPGYYLLSGLSTYASNATGQRAARFTVNGTAVPAGSVSGLGVATTHSHTPPAVRVYLNVGDYAEIQSFQASGGALNTAQSAGYSPGLGANWVSN